MPKKGRYAHVKGSSAYYPFGARTKLRRRQRRHVVLLRVVGLALLVPAAVVAVRQIVFRGKLPVNLIGKIDRKKLEEEK